MTDTSGTMVYRAEFDPYGKLLYEWSSPANLNTRKFTGYERDAATNLDYAQARMYSTDWGRFMSADKLGLTGARLTNPKSLNRYSYASGDPINRVDRNGLEDISWMNCSNCSVTINGGGDPAATMAMYGFNLFGGEQHFMIDDGSFSTGGGGGGQGMGGASDFLRKLAQMYSSINKAKDLLDKESCKDFFKRLGGDIPLYTYLDTKIGVSESHRNGTRFTPNQDGITDGIGTLLNLNGPLFTGKFIDKDGKELDMEELFKMGRAERLFVGFPQGVTSLQEYQILVVLHELAHANDKEGKYKDINDPATANYLNNIIVTKCF
jgi:RHS repeat-associated protein